MSHNNVKVVKPQSKHSTSWGHKTSVRDFGGETCWKDVTSKIQNNVGDNIKRDLTVRVRGCGDREIDECGSGSYVV